MIRPLVTPALGPPDRLTPEPSLPTLRPTAGDVVAILAQQFEQAGLLVRLRAESLAVVSGAAEVILAEFFAPTGPPAASPIPSEEETDVPGL